MHAMAAAEGAAADAAIGRGERMLNMTHQASAATSSHCRRQTAGRR